MKYLLDTNVCIQLLNNRNKLLLNRLSELHAQDICLCSVVEFELFYGAYFSIKKTYNLDKLKRFLSQFLIINFDSKAAQLAGEIRSDLRRKGTPIGVYDLQIAAIALAHEVILVTHNISEFSRVEGLSYEDWEV